MYPKLKLPAMTARDALVLGSGPSFDDYELNELRNSAAVKYGSGHVSRAMTLDHYALADYDSHGKHIASPPTRLHVTQRVWDSLGVDYSTISVAPGEGEYISAGTMALWLAAQAGHDRIFVLGFDGLTDSHGRYRRYRHASSLDPYAEQNFDCGDRFEIDAGELGQISVAQKLQRKSQNLYSLSTHSVLPLPVPWEVGKQPFSRVERHGSLCVCTMPIQVENEEKEKDLLFAVQDLIAYRRRCHPAQAFMVFLGRNQSPWDDPDILFTYHYPKHGDLVGFNGVEVISTFGSY